MRLPPRALLYAGIGLVVLGLVAFAFTWGRVAGLTSVPLQLPYMVSGGLTGLAFVLIGITLVNVQVKLNEEAKRTRQLSQIAELLAELHQHLGTGVTLEGLASSKPEPFEPTDNPVVDTAAV